MLRAITIHAVEFLCETAVYFTSFCCETLYRVLVAYGSLVGNPTLVAAGRSGLRECAESNDLYEKEMLRLRAEDSDEV